MLPIYGTWTDTTIPGENEPENNGIERVLYTSQISRTNYQM